MRRHRDYANKRFTRPRRRGPHGRGRAVGVAVFLTLPLVGLLNLPAVAARLPIQTISVTGARVISPERVTRFITEQIGERRWAIFPQRLAVFFSPRQAEAKLRQHFPFASWSVKRSWLGGVRVAVQEREPQLVWVSTAGAWYLDHDGGAFALVPSVSGNPVTSKKSIAIIRQQQLDNGQLPVVVDERSTPLQPHQSAVSASVVTFIRAVATALQPGGNLGWSTTVTGYRYDPRARKLTAETTDNLEVYFASDQLVADQVAKLRAVIAQGVMQRPGVRYIDVRFGQKVFYQ